MRTLISSCGTSVISNSKEIVAEITGEKNFFAIDWNKVTEEQINEIEKRILFKLEGLEVDNRLFGAEINSIKSLMEHISPSFSGEEVYLLVSDTKDGDLAYRIIKKILKEKLGIKEVVKTEIEGLNPDRKYQFSKKGLRNLVKEMVNIIKKYNGYYDDILIAPIGGFKAQIFMIGLIAQVFGIKSYYMFEKFDEVIPILPLPINFDYDLYYQYYTFFKKLMDNDIVERNELDNYLKKEKKLEYFVDSIREDKKHYVSLSAMGEIYLEKAELFRKSKLPKPFYGEKKFVEKNNEEHARKIVESPKFQKLKNAFMEVEYITSIVIDYYNPQGKDRKTVLKISGKNNEPAIKFEYYDNKLGILGGVLFLTENDSEKLDVALKDLNIRLSDIL